MVEDKNVCKIYLVRHGESEANVDKIVQGHFDSPLTERGIRQANGLAEIFKGVDFAAAYSSDLERAKKTAEIIVTNRGLEVNALADLREKYFGEFEGKRHAEFVDALKDEFYKFENELSEEEMWAHKAHPSMESDAELLLRAKKALNDIASQHIGETILVVVHRYLIRTLLISLGFGAYKNLKDGALEPGGYALLSYVPGVFTVKEVVDAETKKNI